VSVYSEPVETEEVVEKLEGAGSVLILGCPYCASLSLAYINDVPFYKPTRRITWSYGGLHHARLLADVLGGEGKKVEIAGLGFIGTPYCIPGPILKTWLRWRSRGYDAVLVLSCTAGLVGVSRALGRSSKIVHGMRSLGCGTFELRLKPPFRVIVDRKSARVSRFSDS
jgi:hypothetical protein